MANTVDWNTIIVGSSPLLLIEAIYLSRTGRKVLVLEEKDQLGGAWGRLNTNEFPYLDIGCHYWDISQRAYDFLRSNIGINLVPFCPQPQFAYRNVLFPYDYKQTVRMFRDFRTAIRRRAIGSFVSNMLREEYYRPRLLPFTRDFLYPQGGTHELMTQLMSHIRETDVTIKKRMRVENIRFDRKQKQVEVFVDRNSFLADEVVTGSQALVTDALDITPKPNATLRRTHTHVNLIVRDSSAPTFSYIRFLRHHAVIRMTDITSQLRYWNPDISGRRVICIGIREDFDRSADRPEKVSQLIRILRKHDLINRAAECEKSYWVHYPVELLSLETQQRLQQEYSPMIRQISTTNFAMDIASNVSRWERAISLVH